MSELENFRNPRTEQYFQNLIFRLSGFDPFNASTFNSGAIFHDYVPIRTTIQKLFLKKCKTIKITMVNSEIIYQCHEKNNGPDGSNTFLTLLTLNRVSHYPVSCQ